MEIFKLPDPFYAEIEIDLEKNTHGSSIINNDKIPRMKIRIPSELISRINDIGTLLNILSKSKIIRSAIALEDKEKNE